MSSLSFLKLLLSIGSLCAAYLLPGVPCLAEDGAPAPDSVQVKPFVGVKNVLFLVQISHSMLEQFDGDVTKIALARSAVTRLLKVLPTDVNCGLRVYGGAVGITEWPRSNNLVGLDAACRKTELVVRIKPKLKARKDILQFLEQVKPAGRSPMAYALNESLNQDFNAVSDRSAIVLIGCMDSCNGNPLEVVRQHRARGEANIDIYVLGLIGKREPINYAMFSGIGDLAGKYYAADSIDALVSDAAAMNKKLEASSKP